MVTKIDINCTLL